MAAYTSTIHALVNNFNTVALQYADGNDHKQIKSNVQNIYDWVSGQKMASATRAPNQMIEDVTNILTTATGAIENIFLDDTANIMEGCLEIIGSVAVLIGGMYGTVTLAICSILGGVLSASRRNGPDRIEQLHNVVHQELLQFHQRLLDEKFSGLQLCMSNLMRDLKDMTCKKNIPSGAEKVPDDLLQFIGEVADGFVSKVLNVSSTKQDTDDVVRAMVVYSLAQTSTQTLLTVMLIKYKGLKLHTQYVDNKMEVLRNHAVTSLSFLSDKRYLTTEGLLKDRKFIKMMALRNNTTAYRIVEKFRVSMKMTKMVSYNEIKECARLLKLSVTTLTTDSYETPENGKGHYIRFINKTDYPMKVVSGNVGGNISNLEFTYSISPHRSYCRKIQSNISAGGYFVMYLDGHLQPDDAQFEGDVKIIEFSLSNPFIGGHKIKIMDKTDNINGIGECWKEKHTPDGTPIHWVHNSKFYKTSCDYALRTWMYVVEEYSPN